MVQMIHVVLTPDGRYPCKTHRINASRLIDSILVNFFYINFLLKKYLKLGSEKKTLSLGIQFIRVVSQSVKIKKLLQYAALRDRCLRTICNRLLVTRVHG